jgi:hypothetical protein
MPSACATTSFPWRTQAALSATALVARFGPASLHANASSTVDPATQNAMKAWEDQLAAVEATERAIAEGRAGRHPADIRRLDETLVRGRERLEQLRQEMVLALTPPAAPTGPQAPRLDPFALERAQIVYQQLLERLTGTRSLFDEINFSWQTHSNVVQQAIAQIDKAQIRRTGGKLHDTH